MDAPESQIRSTAIAYANALLSWYFAKEKRHHFRVHYNGNGNGARLFYFTVAIEELGECHLYVTPDDHDFQLVTVHHVVPVNLTPHCYETNWQRFLYEISPIVEKEHNR